MWAAVAFWIAVAAICIAAGYFKIRREALRHETVCRIIEKTGEVDEEKVRGLLQGSPGAMTYHPPAPGHWYKFFRGLGVVILAVAAGTVLLVSIVSFGGEVSEEERFFGYGMAAFGAAVGLGVFLSAAYCRKPPASEAERKDLL